MQYIRNFRHDLCGYLKFRFFSNKSCCFDCFSWHLAFVPEGKPFHLSRKVFSVSPMLKTKIFSPHRGFVTKSHIDFSLEISGN